jgi:hypothetical protein
MPTFHRLVPPHQRVGVANHNVELLPRHGVCAITDRDFQRDLWAQESLGGVQCGIYRRECGMWN